MRKKELIENLNDIKNAIESIPENSNVEVNNLYDQSLEKWSLSKTDNGYSLKIGDHTNLDQLDVFLATEASERWGFNKNYVRREYNSRPEKFLKGSIRLFGTAYIITREGMEHLTGLTEKEANSWIIWHEKEGSIDFIKYRSSEARCKEFIWQLYQIATKKKDFTVHFSDIDDNISWLNIPGEGRYYYARNNYFFEYQNEKGIILKDL